MIMILALCIPVTALVTGYFTLKGVHMCLKWQYELKHEEKPVMDVSEPIANLFKTNEKPKTETANILNEWLNGPSEQR